MKKRILWDTHTNMFADGSSEQEVYALFQRDYDADVRRQSMWHWIFVGVALGGITFSGHKEWFWLFAGMYALERAISRYIDNSNRNWAMHVIDWMRQHR